MRRTAALLTVAFGALSAACAAAAPETSNPATAQAPRRQPTAIEELRIDAARLRREDPSRWAAHEAAAEAVLDEHARRTAGWRRRAPPPPPDLRHAALPAPFLWAELASAAREGSRIRRDAFAVALVASGDPRGLAAALELHDAPERAPDGLERLSRRIAGTIAAAAPGERLAAVLLAQVRREPEVERGALALQLLERLRERSPRGTVDLPPETAEAARAWLAGYERGPANGLGADVWSLRLRLGGAGDRDALVPFVLDGEDLLHDLRVILDAPLPHARLAEALRMRRATMTEHERSFLVPYMRRALLVTAPDAELAAFLDSVRRRIGSPIRARGPTDDARLDLHIVADVEDPLAADARARWIADDRLEWVDRLSLLSRVIQRERSDAPVLREWWRENAPEEMVRRLRDWLGEA